MNSIIRDIAIRHGMNFIDYFAIVLLFASLMRPLRWIRHLHTVQIGSRCGDRDFALVCRFAAGNSRQNRVCHAPQRHARLLAACPTLPGSHWRSQWRHHHRRSTSGPRTTYRQHRLCT